MDWTFTLLWFAAYLYFTWRAFSDPSPEPTVDWRPYLPPSYFGTPGA
jgi:hypothetical protein